MSAAAPFAAIEPFIPQRAPFIMIDTLLETSAYKTRTAFRIPQDHLFVYAGCLTEPGLIENMAQTAAAGMGAQTQAKGMAAPVGFIGALKNWRVQCLPAAGTVITTETTCLHQIMNAHVVLAEIRLQDTVIASCELKIFIQ
jgi:predicted hotdog family 3-hydroxylacyl-ACP dehydratase